MARLAPVRTASRASVRAISSPSRCSFAFRSAGTAGASCDANFKASVLSVVCCNSAVSTSPRIANASCSDSLLTTSSLITCLMPPANSVSEAASTRTIVLNITMNRIQVKGWCKAEPGDSIATDSIHKAAQLTANSKSLGLHRSVLLFLALSARKMSTRQRFPGATARPPPTLRCGSCSWRIACSNRTTGSAACSSCSHPRPHAQPLAASSCLSPHSVDSRRSVCGAS